VNPEIKAKWVAALRSCEYQQGEDSLRTDNKFCCLGVLCDLHSKETGIEWEVPWLGQPCMYLGEEGLLPDAVVLWAEAADSSVGSVSISGSTSRLAEHNDDGCTFAEIADAIEAQL
jgi:hypothetical protein